MSALPHPNYKRVHQRLNPSLADNSTSGRNKIWQEGRCRTCGGTENLTRHHLVEHAWFVQRKPELRVLRNANANIVPLCTTCHEVVDGREPVLRLKKRAALRQALYANEVAFILQIRGRDWFELSYPLDP